MCPWQLCHQRCHFLVPAVDLVELTHPKQIATREPALAWQLAREVLGQAVNHAFPPDRRLKLGTDVAPDFPVQGHQFGVDRLVCALARLLDELHNLCEGRFDGLKAGGHWQWGGRRWTGRHACEPTKRRQCTRFRASAPCSELDGCARRERRLSGELCRAVEPLLLAGCGHRKFAANAEQLPAVGVSQTLMRMVAPRTGLCRPMSRTL